MSENMRLMIIELVRDSSLATPFDRIPAEGIKTVIAGHLGSQYRTKLFQLPVPRHGYLVTVEKLGGVMRNQWQTEGFLKIADGDV